jgi:hypothetical protein
MVLKGIHLACISIFVSYYAEQETVGKGFRDKLNSTDSQRASSYVERGSDSFMNFLGAVDQFL